MRGAMTIEGLTDKMPAISAKDEQRIRHAIRYVIEATRSQDGPGEIQCVFDLIPYLGAEAYLIAQDEMMRTLADLIGGD